VYGWDVTPPSWLAGSPAVSCPPLDSVAAVRYNGQVTQQGSAVIKGDPNREQDSTLTASNMLGGSTFNQLKAMATLTLTGNVSGLAPVTVGNPPVCDKTVESNWGAPTDKANACFTYFPIIYHYGDLSISGTGAGQDLHASLTITLNDAAKGTKTRVHLPTGKDVEVKIPAGIASGQQIRLKGQGWPSASGRAGDALITVNVAPHSLFKPDGNDLRLELPITLYEAALGGKVRVPTLDGAVELAIPAGTNSGRTFRLKGKGLKAKGGSGDLLATVRIMLPERTDDTFTEMMKSWRDKKPYDPRGDLE